MVDSLILELSVLEVDRGERGVCKTHKCLCIQVTTQPSQLLLAVCVPGGTDSSAKLALPRPLQMSLVDSSKLGNANFSNPNVTLCNFSGTCY